jgi:spore coat protein U-like protein
MVSGADQLFYNLYLDAARTIIWGDGTGGTQSFFIGNPQGNNQDLSVPMFGRIPASQNVKVGAYTDTVTVTLSF